MEWTWLKDWWRLKKWRKNSTDSVCYCDDCIDDVNINLRTKQYLSCF